jgi:1,4-dihydroxy-2-naphthoate polyprenyltransferase
VVADSAPPARPSPARVWLRALRPFSFPASIVPVAVGAAAAAVSGHFSPGLTLLTLLGCVALQAGTNLSNEFYDWRSGADHAGSLGASRAIMAGWLSPRAILRAAVACFVVGCAAGFALVAAGGWPILALGLVGVPLAWGYTAPPLKLAYRGLGEVAVFFLMGPLMVLGSYLVQSSASPATALVASLPVGCLVAAILHANNVRDLDDDRRLGKRTLATILGRTGARREYDALVGGAYLSLLGGVLLALLPWTTLLALLSLPLAVRVRTIVATGADPHVLDPTVRRTAALHLVFGLLLAAGLVLGAWRRW